MAFYPAGLKTYTLQSSISSTATSITLTSLTYPVTNEPVTWASLNTDIAYGTLDPKTDRSEFISFTGITQNGNGTATLTGVARGLQRAYPYTADVGYQLPHAGASQFIFSDAPQVFNKYAGLDNDNTWGGTNVFTGVVHVPTSTDPDAPATYGQLASTAIAGAVDASTTVKGIGKVSVTPASPTNPIFVGDNDPRVPTQSENDALVGDHGTASSTNTFVTQTGFQRNSEKFAITAGTGGAYTATLSPAPSLSTGMSIGVMVHATNTSTTPTLNVNSTGAKTIVKGNASPLVVGDISTSMIVGLVYSGASNGDNWILGSPVVSQTTGLSSLGGYWVATFQPVSSGQSTSEVTMTTFTIPANTLGKGMLSMRFPVSSVFGGNTDVATRSCTFRLKLGSTTLATMTLNQADNNANFQTILGMAEAIIAYDGTTSSQRGYFSYTGQYSSTSMSWSFTSNYTSSINMTTSQTLSITCQWSGAAHGNDAEATFGAGTAYIVNNVIS